MIHFVLYNLRLKSAWESLGNEGKRVIAFALRHFNAAKDAKFDAESTQYWGIGLTFLGMSAIMDPPRLELALSYKQNICYCCFI